MALDFDILEDVLKGEDRNPIQCDCGDLTGLTRQESSVGKSPCIAMKWMCDNGPYHWQTFVQLSSKQAWQGVRAYNDKGMTDIHKEIKVDMGGGDTGNPGDQIYIHNKFITNACLDMVETGEDDFDTLGALIEKNVSEGRHNPVGCGAGDLTGVPLLEAGVFRSPCGSLKWAEHNSDYTYLAFVELSCDKGEQGLEIFKDGKFYRRIPSPMGGGNNADPNKIIYNNNRRIIGSLLRLVHDEMVK